MVRMRYPGVSDPKTAFEALRPYRAALLELEMRCRPFGPDYLVLMAAKDALDTAAFHFTRDPQFFALKPARSVGGGS
jgi:hypothetical protein